MTEKSGVNPILDLVQTNGFTKSIPDIKLAHARQNSSNTANQIVGYIPDPIRVSPCTPKSQLRLSKISMDSNHSSSTRIKPSRVLQALDTCERRSPNIFRCHSIYMYFLTKHSPYEPPWMRCYHCRI